MVGPNGEQVGIVRVEDALRLAAEADLDLVEVAPMAKPPVAKLMDFGKFKYETALKAREARKNQVNTVIKEIKLRPKIDPHDYGTKKGHVERFLTAGDKVKVTIMFRGREQSRPELGFRLLQRLAQDIVELGFVESAPKQDGRNMIMVLGPTRKKADAKAEQRRRVSDARQDSRGDAHPDAELIEIAEQIEIAERVEIAEQLDAVETELAPTTEAVDVVQAEPAPTSQSVDTVMPAPIAAEAPDAAEPPAAEQSAPPPAVVPAQPISAQPIPATADAVAPAPAAAAAAAPAASSPDPATDAPRPTPIRTEANPAPVEHPQPVAKPAVPAKPGESSIKPAKPAPPVPRPGPKTAATVPAPRPPGPKAPLPGPPPRSSS